jgi:hypothetical protein
VESREIFIDHIGRGLEERIMFGADRPRGVYPGSALQFLGGILDAIRSECRISCGLNSLSVFRPRHLVIFKAQLFQRSNLRALEHARKSIAIPNMEWITLLGFIFEEGL